MTAKPKTIFQATYFLLNPLSNINVMIFFSIADPFYKKIILDCLAQIDPKLVSEINQIVFVTLSLLIDNKKIKIIFDGADLQLKNPLFFSRSL
jgi:hypothetical protein